MKAIYKTLLAAVAVTPLLTGCIEEAIDSSVITSGDLQGNAGATTALVWGMPARLNLVTLDPIFTAIWAIPAYFTYATS